jgi:hypothetical protein
VEGGDVFGSREVVNITMGVAELGRRNNKVVSEKSNYVTTTTARGRIPKEKNQPFLEVGQVKWLNLLCPIRNITLSSSYLPSVIIAMVECHKPSS